MPKEIAIGVVIVSYHSPERTIQLVTQQLPKLPWAYRACVVDVAATDETRAILSQGLPKDVACLEFDENLGYSRGNNRGAEYLSTQLPCLQYFLFCNDDIEIPEGANLEALRRDLDAHPEFGIVGPECTGEDGKPQSPWNSADDLGRTESRTPRPSPFGGRSRTCYAVRGCFLLVRAPEFLSIRGFDEAFFLFFEEPVLGERFRKLGQKTYYEAEAHLRHLGSATIKKSLSAPKIYQLYRASFFRIARCYWGWSAWQCWTWPLRHLMARLARFILKPAP